MDVDIRPIKTYFESQNIFLSDVWLESCIQWCIEEALPQSYTKANLHSEIYEQWLLLDLREVSIPVLPPNLSDKKLYILNGNYCLQVMEIIDISKPKLGQLDKIRKKFVLTKSVDEENDGGTGKRVLQLALTDGVQEVQAMEYRPIRALKLNMAPGIKMRISGPVKVRRGQIMLEENHIKILGGEVEELLVPNAAENVLARRLNLPLNLQPRKFEETADAVEQQESQYYPSNDVKSKSVVQPRNIQTSNSVANNRVDQHNSTSYQNQINRNHRVNMNEQDMIDEEINLLLDAEESLLSQSQRNQNKTIQSAASIVKNPVVPISLDDDDGFGDIDIDAHLDQAEKILSQQASSSKSNKIELKIPKPNIITIAKLLQNKISICRAVFKVKARFKEVIEKVEFDENEYKLTIKIEDESGDMVVKIHSDIIANFAGSSPSELMRLKAGFISQDTVAVRKVLTALQNIKEKLITLDQVMEVLVTREEKLCTVMKLL